MRRVTILLLDDDPDVGLAAQLLLQRRVAPVLCLHRPAELAAALDRVRPALLLLDMNFGPGRTDGTQGLRLLAQARQHPQPPVVVAMTAYAEIDLAVQAVKQGAFDFLTKPWDNVRLVATCRDALQAHAAAAAGPVGPDAAGVDVGAKANEASLGGARATDRSLAAQERAALLSAMAESEGNLSAAARRLGLSRAALYRRLDKHGL